MKLSNCQSSGSISGLLILQGVLIEKNENLIMELIGKTTINPIIFYTGKISGYISWIVLLLSLLGVNAVNKYSLIYNDYFAFISMTIGLFTVIISFINLGQSIRLGLPSNDTQLKTSGLYKISRNPMYLGFNLLTISSMIYFLNILIIVPGIFSIIVYHLIILGEERFLGKRFGSEYECYKKIVRRYI